VDGGEILDAQVRKEQWAGAVKQVHVETKGTLDSVEEQESLDSRDKPAKVDLLESREQPVLLE
jgi:hypothetical protein